MALWCHVVSRRGLIGIMVAEHNRQVRANARVAADMLNEPGCRIKENSRELKGSDDLVPLKS
jgi:hypothetical protein